MNSIIKPYKDIYPGPDLSTLTNKVNTIENILDHLRVSTDWIPDLGLHVFEFGGSVLVENEIGDVEAISPLASIAALASTPGYDLKDYNNLDRADIHSYTHLIWSLFVLTDCPHCLENVERYQNDQEPLHATDPADFLSRLLSVLDTLKPFTAYPDPASTLPLPPTFPSRNLGLLSSLSTKDLVAQPPQVRFDEVLTGTKILDQVDRLTNQNDPVLFEVVNPSDYDWLSEGDIVLISKVGFHNPNAQYLITPIKQGVVKHGPQTYPNRSYGFSERHMIDDVEMKVCDFSLIV
jgi:hypothetical protein